MEKYIQKFTLTIILLLLALNLYSQDSDYIRPYLLESGISPIYDLRYLNDIEDRFSEQLYNTAWAPVLEVEDSEGLEPINQIYEFIYNERNFLRTSSFQWAHSNPIELYQDVVQSLSKGQPVTDLLPPTVSFGSGHYASRYLISNLDMSDYLQSLSFGEFIKSDLFGNENGYYFSLAGFQSDEAPNKTIFCIEPLEQTLFSGLNGKYELTNIYFSKWPTDAEEIDIQWFIDNNFEPSQLKQMAYGISDGQVYYQEGETYQIIADSLKLRSSPNVESGDIIRSLYKEEMVTLIEVGEYAVINHISGDWFQIRTSDNTVGWCFGSSLFIRWFPF